TEQREAQHVLRELTESLTTTLNSIADGVIAIDADGAVGRMNPIAEKLTGWLSGDARGKPVNQVLHLVDADTRAAAALPVVGTSQPDSVGRFASQTLLIGRDGL